jgi:hypothetical protein
MKLAYTIKNRSKGNFINYTKRYFPRNVNVSTKQEPNKMADLKLGKSEKTFKQSLHDADNVEDFLDSALYQ